MLASFCCCLDGLNLFRMLVVLTFCQSVAEAEVGVLGGNQGIAYALTRSAIFVSSALLGFRDRLQSLKTAG